MLVRTFAAPGEKVLIQTPVYHPFYSAITHNAAEIARNPLVNDGGRYRMDFADLEAKLADPAVKLAILCSPHNPVGRVWTAAELRRFGELCLDSGVPVVADEIHGDLILPGHAFTPFASIGAELAQNVIVCTAPSKTFNLAGLKTSNLIIPNPELRRRFSQAYTRSGLFGMNAFGLAATEAAYTDGDEWLDQMLAYLDGNRRALEEYVAAHLPQIRVTPLEGTYLAWLDCRELGLDTAALKRLMIEQARIYPDQGAQFGAEGAGFIRLNIACPRAILVEALERIKAAIGFD
jgi:cystathionine beta-lyase